MFCPDCVHTHTLINKSSSFAYSEAILLAAVFQQGVFHCGYGGSPYLDLFTGQNLERQIHTP